MLSPAVCANRIHHKYRYFSYSHGDFEVFTQQGRQVARCTRHRLGIIRIHGRRGRCLDFLVTGSCAKRVRRYIRYSKAILRFFAPQGRHVAPIWVKFGVEESTEGGLLYAKFNPVSWCVRPQNVKILCNFGMNINAPQGPFYARLGIEISMDLLKGLWSYGE